MSVRRDLWVSQWSSRVVPDFRAEKSALPCSDSCGVLEVHRIFRPMEVAAPEEPVVTEDLYECRVHAARRALLVVLRIKIPGDTPGMKRQLADGAFQAEDEPAAIGTECRPFSRVIDRLKRLSEGGTEKLVAGDA